MKKTKHQNEQGFAMLAVILTSIVLLGSILFISQLMLSTTMASTRSANDVALLEGCKSGIDIGVDALWSGYLDQPANGGQAGDITSYLNWVDGVVEADDELDILDAINAGAPWALNGGVRITSLTAARVDDATGANFTLSTTANINGQTRTATQRVRIGAESVNFPDFALLSNNINCIMCHAQIKSLDKELNTDPSKYGTFDRVKVGSLESLMLSTLWLGGGDFTAHGNVEGSIYTRGELIDFAGTGLTADSLSDTSMTMSQVDGDGYIVQDGSGNTTDLTPGVAGTDGDGLPQSNQNLYLDYPTDKALMADGELPTSFPSAFADLDDDRVLSDYEFEPYMNEATGSITGGVVFGVNDGDTFSNSSGLPSASNDAGTDLASSGAHEGNLILVGTDANPIVIDGTVVVDGDLVLQGPVIGTGELQVRGNIYVTGDVTYADAAGEFGVADDGTVNALAVKAGGNILMGDFQTRSAIEKSSNINNFGQAGHIEVNQSNPGYTDNSGTLAGYFSPGAEDTGTWVTGSDEHWMSFTSVELAMFNAGEVDKAVADPDYIPRLYQLNNDHDHTASPYFDGSSEFAVEWLGGDITSKQYNNGDFYPIDPDIANRAVFQNLEPQANWITNDTLRKAWYNADMAKSAGDPFKFDGLLYTDNALFGIVKNWQYHKSNTHGKFQLRGSVYAPDLGMLVPGSDFSVPRDAFTLLYDPRLKQFVNIENTNTVEVTRGVYRNDA